MACLACSRAFSFARALQAAIMLKNLSDVIKFLQASCNQHLCSVFARLAPPTALWQAPTTTGQDQLAERVHDAEMPRSANLTIFMP
jgi:hypothetical protein